MPHITKKQHYIPKAILKNFTINGTYLYEGQIIGNSCYKTNVNNSMCERNIYEHDDLKVNTIENFFANTIDSNLSSLGKEILLILDSDFDNKIASVYQCIVKYITDIVLCYFRSGAILVEYNTAYKHDKGRIILKVFENTPIKYIKALGQTILNGYDFAIIQNDKNHFIIGDQYLATCALRIKSNFSNASNRQIGFKHTILILPISSCYCLIFFHGEKPSYIKKNEICNLDDMACKQINLAIKNSAYKKIAGADLDIIRDLILENEINGRYQSPITAVMKYSDGSSIGFVNKKEAFFYDRDYDTMKLFHSFKFDLKLGRNDKCYCGSGKKHKRCCIEKTEIINDMCRSFKLEGKNTGDYVINSNIIVERSIQIPEREYSDLISTIDKVQHEKGTEV